MPNELHQRHERPEWSFHVAIVNKLQSLFFLFFVLFSHPVDTHPSPKSDRITLIFIEHHTGEEAKADYQRRDYALESFLTWSPVAF